MLGQAWACSNELRREKKKQSRKSTKNPSLKPQKQKQREQQQEEATMVKAYLRYEPAAAFGVIASVDSNITYDSSGKHLLSPALEKIAVWHVRQGICTKTLTPPPPSRGPSPAVTSIASTPSSSLVTIFILHRRIV